MTCDPLLCVWYLQAAEMGRPPERTSRFYAKGALQYLVSLLTQALAKQVYYLSVTPLLLSYTTYVSFPFSNACTIYRRNMMTMMNGIRVKQLEFA